MSACGNVPCSDCSNTECSVSIGVSLGHILVLASAGRGKLNAADWRFVLLIAYPPMELFLVWVLALWAAAFGDGRFGIHGLLASIARPELNAAFRFCEHIIVSFFFCLGLEHLGVS